MTYSRRNEGRTKTHDRLKTGRRKRKTAIRGPPAKSFIGTRHATEVMREKERELRQIIDLVPHLIFAKDIDGRFILANKAVADIYGTTVEEMQGKLDRDFVQSEAEAQNFRNDDLEVIRSGKTRVIPEEVITDITGRVHFLSTVKTPCWFARSGKPGCLGVAVDITERKQMEDALRESETLLRVVTSSARVGLSIVNAEGRYIFVNQTFVELAGLPDANVVGKHVREVFPELYGQIKPNLERGLRGERLTYELHMSRDRHTGRERFFEIAYEPRLRGNEWCLVVVVMEITERKQAHQLLERTVAERTAKLNEIIQELEGFSYSIAHDMRAPLRAMQGFSEILLVEHGPQLTDEAREYLERIHTAADRLDQLTRDVLSYSRVVRQELKIETVDLALLVPEIIQTYPDLKVHAARIEVRPPMPKVLGNKAALTQVISNLLGNAVKFVAPGVQPHIRILSESVASGWVRIWFVDNGIGIPDRARGRLFEMFQRFTDEKSYPGTGIGLAIARKAVERMGAKIGVEPGINNGSRFWIELKEA